MMREQLTRRNLLRGSAGLLALAPVLAACQQAPAAVQTAAPEVVERVVTQIVEQPVEVVVTQIVENTVEVTQAPVEVVVTATAMPMAPASGKLTWWAWGSEQTGFPAWRKQIARFNEIYPNVEVDLQPALGYDKVAVTMAAGTAADIIMINMPSGYSFIGHDQIVNLQPFINGDPSWTEDIATFHAGSLDGYTFRGDLYAIPQSLETSGTIYNVDMMREAGLTPPAELGAEWTWDKFREYAIALTKGEGQEKVWGTYMSPDPQSGLGDLVYPLGGRWVLDNGIETGIASEEFIQGAQFAADMVTVHQAAPPPQALSGADAGIYTFFVNLRCAMMLSGDWAYGWVLTRQLEDKKFAMDWAPSPAAPNGQYAAVGHYVAQGGYQGSKNKDALIAFMRQYSTKASQEDITNGWENYPALAPRMDAQDFFWNLKLVPNEEGLRASFAANLPYPRTPVGDVSPIVVGPVNNAMNAIMDGQDTRSPADVLPELATTINDDLAKSAEALGG